MGIKKRLRDFLDGFRRKPRWRVIFTRPNREWQVEEISESSTGTGVGVFWDGRAVVVYVCADCEMSAARIALPIMREYHERAYDREARRTEVLRRINHELFADAQSD